MSTKTPPTINAVYLPEGFLIEEVSVQMEEPLQQWIEAFGKDRYQALYRLGFLKKESWFSPSLTYLHHIAENLIKSLSHQPDIELSREEVQVVLLQEQVERLKNQVPFVIGMEYVDYHWISWLWKRLLAVFTAEIKDYDGTVARYFAEYSSNINVVGRIFFHLVENQSGDKPFAFMATYSTKPVKSKKALHTPLKNALKEFDEDEKKLLSLISTVIKAAEQSPFISELLESGELFSPLKLTADEAYTMLQEIPLYEEAGIMCRVPDWWRKKSNSLRVSITLGEKKPSRIGLEALIDFTPTLMLGDETITEKEVRDLLETTERLLRYKGKWVEVDRKKLEAALEAFEKVKILAPETGLTLREALRMELHPNQLPDVSVDEIDLSVSNGQWLRSIREHLTHPESIPRKKRPSSFCAVLREYQEQGYHWLNQMASLGLGACLADDMGLGKTVQMIAFLEQRRISQGGSALLIVPASLIGNWQKEIERFAPEMPWQILHTSSAAKPGSVQIEENAFLYITTYGMTSRLEALRERQWDYLIIDEAQAIKNPGTKQTKAVKAIPSKNRIALTGTPIENKLGDLWSLFDFLNQGLLGTTKEFKSFTKKLSQETTGYARLRRIIQPFMLRRLKTDKRIIADLPDKMEMNAYTTLSKQQVMLYQQLVQQISKKLSEVEGIERKGLVLSSIMKFKQICNHPDQYLGKEIFKPDHSGKFQQLKDICETIYEKRERVLVFTQFKEMTEPLSAYLAEIFSREGLVLHGGTPVKRRSEMVEQFNGEAYIPYLVMSLKAGGVGLNLTGANHVIHFDRWWNPAVENQATDRAFRIGQQKNVMVHRFVTKGTIEEKIDAMLEDKKQLSGDLLESGDEKWITEYSNQELVNLFTLRSDE